MPYTNIENSGKGSNKGSCRTLVNYLCKENEGKSLLHQEHFFSCEKAHVNRLEVTKAIDTNIAKLGRADSKFFMLTLNFSQSELGHIGNDSEKIKEYTRMVMESYAKNFNKGLKSSDLVWFGKVEFHRHYKGFEKEVLNGIAKQGERKPGLNTHVHLIISRKDKTQKLKLSPMTNHRQSSKGIIKSGFNRMQFKVECEKSFDKYFQYQRNHGDYLIVSNTLKNGSREEKATVKEAIYRQQSPLLAVLRVVKSANAFYPEDTEEERKRKRGNNQGYQY